MTAETFGNALSDELTKPTKGASVSSVSPSDKGFENLNLWLRKLKVAQTGLSSEKPLPGEPTKLTEKTDSHGLTADELKATAGKDWTQDGPATLEALVRSTQIRRMRERGEIPQHYTATTLCDRCGWVPIFPGVGERVKGCPWCFNRISGLPVPRATRD